MKKTVLIIPIVAAILFVIVTINTQTKKQDKTINQTSEFKESTIKNYADFTKISTTLEKSITDFKPFFEIYLEEIPIYYQEYYNKLNTVKTNLIKLEEKTESLNELCNIPLSDGETTKICNNYSENYTKIKESYDNLIKAFNETITNYNNLAKYKDDLAELELYK